MNNNRCICPNGHVYSTGKNIGDQCGNECRCGKICTNELIPWSSGINCQLCECNNNYSVGNFINTADKQQPEKLYFTCDKCNHKYRISTGQNSKYYNSHMCNGIDYDDDIDSEEYDVGNIRNSKYRNDNINCYNLNINEYGENGDENEDNNINNIDNNISNSESDEDDNCNNYNGRNALRTSKYNYYINENHYDNYNNENNSNLKNNKVNSCQII